MTQPRRNRPAALGVSSPMRPLARLAASATLVCAALVAIACAAPAGSLVPLPTDSPNPSAGSTAAPTPLPSAPTPTAPAAVQVGSAAQAAAVVFAHEHIGRMTPLQPDVIGQASWYEAYAEVDGFGVKISVGAGDCQAGCIERHTWTYHVDLDGTVTLVADEGDDVGLPAADGTTAPLTLRVSLTAGPVCPVQHNPPDPNCAPRPLVNVEVAVFDVAGNQVASEMSGIDGVAVVNLPAGAYYAATAPVEGLIGKAEPLAFSGVGGDTVGLAFVYDTGIR